MAEWGKGDSRWLVEERADGANVNQWHWTEKDCMHWSRQRIQELFQGLELFASGDAKASVTAVDNVEGEAFMNIRKKKLIPSYELKITLSFAGQAANGENIAGKVVLPYVAEENHDEDPEVQVKPEQDSPAARILKDGIYNNRAQTLYKRIAVFVDDFHAGKPAGHEEGAAAKPVVVDHSATAKNAAETPAATSGRAAAGGRGGRTGAKIVLKETFYASANDLFEALTNENRIRAFTQSEACVSSDVGGAFSMFGGSIQGHQRELVPGKRIVQDWRFNTWPDGVYSKVTLDIVEPEPGHTHVTMTQEGIPHEDKFGNHDVVGTTENGWKNLIFYRIRAVFGYGL